MKLTFLCGSTQKLRHGGLIFHQCQIATLSETLVPALYLKSPQRKPGSPVQKADLFESLASSSNSVLIKIHRIFTRELTPQSIRCPIDFRGNLHATFFRRLPRSSRFAHHHQNPFSSFEA